METERPDRGESGASPPREPGWAPPSGAIPASPALAGGGSSAIAPGDGPPSADYPARFEIDRQERYSRLLPFVKWLLAIPHFLVLLILFAGAIFAGIGAFFAVLFTGKYPPGIFRYMTGVLRWAYRTGSYVCLLTDRYPPFSLDDDADYPVRMEIAHPDKIANWRPLVHWLLVIPYYLIAYILQAIWVYLIVVISFFAILFTGKYPQPLFDFALVAQRWNLRANAYMYFMTERYPPFAYA